MNTQQAKQELEVVFSQNQNQKALQSLRAHGLIQDETPEQRLAGAIDDHFEACMDDITESHVLHHDYGWSALQIVDWRKKRVPALSYEEEDVSEIEVLRELVSHNRSWRFEKNCTAQRAFFFFYFFELDRTHREAALTQVPVVWKLIDEDLLRVISDIFQWTAHEVLELNLLVEEKLRI